MHCLWVHRPNILNVAFRWLSSHPLVFFSLLNEKRTAVNMGLRSTFNEVNDVTVNHADLANKASCLNRYLMVWLVWFSQIHCIIQYRLIFATKIICIVHAFYFSLSKAQRITNYIFCLSWPLIHARRSSLNAGKYQCPTTIPVLPNKHWLIKCTVMHQRN